MLSYCWWQGQGSRDSFVDKAECTFFSEMFNFYLEDLVKYIRDTGLFCIIVSIL